MRGVPKDAEWAKQTCEMILATMRTAVLGKEQQIRLALTCMLAQGHLLIEDVPGVGKTTLAHALAGALGLRFNRVQFTSDLMPADVLGGSIFDRESQGFVFQPGPIFTEVLLADEVNRTSPKTQSALLEAMAESQVSVEGKTHKLPDPFFVIATQNPSHQRGTFPIPESQMDRFLMSISLGYPDEASEKRMLMTGRHKTSGHGVSSAVDKETVLLLQSMAAQVSISEAVASYAHRVIRASREQNVFVDGLSPRAGMAWMRAAQAWAMLDGRTWVLPDDLQAVFAECALHRLQHRSSAKMTRAQTEIELREWMSKHPVTRA